VIRAIADALNLGFGVLTNSGDDDGNWSSTWVIVTDNEKFLEIKAIAEMTAKARPSRTARLWTDEYSNLFEILR
jgi:hypothetical protein